jgi:hypothetical protein
VTCSRHRRGEAQDKQSRRADRDAVAVIGALATDQLRFRSTQIGWPLE